MLRMVPGIAVLLLTSVTPLFAGVIDIPEDHLSKIYWDAESGWKLNQISYGRWAAYIDPQLAGGGIEERDVPPLVYDAADGREAMFEVKAMGISVFNLFGSGDYFMSKHRFRDR